MIRWLINKRLDAFERRIGVSLDYLRHMVAAAPSVFFKFAKLPPLAAYRRALPADVLHVARIVAARHEDCGPCVQMAVNFALQEGMSPEAIQAVLDEDTEQLEEPLADAYFFTQAVVSHNGDDQRWRERIRSRFGEQGLIELSLAAAIGGVFPRMKRGMGYSATCQQVKVAVEKERAAAGQAGGHK